MNKGELFKMVSERLKAEGSYKRIIAPKHTFHISDDNGNMCDFNIKGIDRSIPYSRNEISTIVGATLDTISDMLEMGESINLHGFGIFSIQKRATRQTKIPGTDEWVQIDEHYVPKFTSGKKLRMAAKLYELGKDGEE